MKPAAPLTSALLARKGTASPIGFALATLKVPRPAAVSFSAVPPPAAGRVHDQAAALPSEPLRPVVPAADRTAAPVEAPAAIEEAATLPAEEPAPAQALAASLVHDQAADPPGEPATSPAAAEPDESVAPPGVGEDASAASGPVPANDADALAELARLIVRDEAAVAVPMPAESDGGRSASEARETARLSLRVDRDRHLRLKLLAVHLQRSAQDILLEALDQHLNRIAPHFTPGKCACCPQLAGDPPGVCLSPGDGTACARAAAEPSPDPVPAPPPTR